MGRSGSCIRTIFKDKTLLKDKPLSRNVLNSKEELFSKEFKENEEIISKRLQFFPQNMAFALRNARIKESSLK